MAQDTTNDDRADVVVIGAGIGGLVAAATAAETDPSRRVVLIEPHRDGGRARCDQVDGFTFNRGPRALYPGGPAARVFRDLGIDTSAASPPKLRSAALWSNGALHRFPTGPIAAARSTAFGARAKASIARALSALWTEPTPPPDQTLAAWCDHRGLEGPARQFVESLVRVSTYIDAPETVAAAPALASARAGISPGVRYLDGGWQSLVDQLAARAEGLGVERVRAAVAQVRAAAAGGGWTVSLRGDRRVGATAVVLAVGGPDAAAALLGVPAPWNPVGPPATAACLELGVRALPSRRFVLGLDAPVYLSVHAPPARLAPAGMGVVHVMRYQSPSDTMPAAEQQEQLWALARQVGLTDDDIAADRFLAHMVVTGALPTAASGGLMGRPPGAVVGHPGVFVAGDWVGPEGLLLDAVCASGAEAGRLAVSPATLAVQGRAPVAKMAGS